MLELAGDGTEAPARLLRLVEAHRSVVTLGRRHLAAAAAKCSTLLIMSHIISIFVL